MKVTRFATPTPNSGPRRGHVDSQDRLWFAEYRGNNIGMFDTKTDQFKEYAAPTPWTNPYDAVLDNAGYAWAGGMSNDHVVRVNTKSGETTDYLLPRTTNVRRVNVDNSTNPANILGWATNLGGGRLPNSNRWKYEAAAEKSYCWNQVWKSERGRLDAAS